MKPITQRQATLIALAARGCGAKEIARELGIAVNTARVTLQQARELTDSRNVAHLVAKSLSRGWIPPLLLALMLSLVADGSNDKVRHLARIRIHRTQQQSRREA